MKAEDIKIGDLIVFTQLHMEYPEQPALGRVYQCTRLGDTTATLTTPDPLWPLYCLDACKFIVLSFSEYAEATSRR
jgi:cell shape-determining protein MreC